MQAVFENDYQDGEIHWSPEETRTFEGFCRESDDWSTISIQMQNSGFPERPLKDMQSKWRNMKTLQMLMMSSTVIKTVKSMDDLKNDFDVEDCILEESEVFEVVSEEKKSFMWNSKETRALVDVYKKLNETMKPGDRWEDISEHLKAYHVFKPARDCCKNFKKIHISVLKTLSF